MMENKTKIDLKNKSIFITGAAGFIGSNLAKRLLSTVEGVKVVGLDNMNHYYDVRLKEARLNELEKFENFSFVKGNLADKSVIEAIFEQYKPEIVVNLGAQAGVRYSITNPDAYVEANLIGFYNILEACRHSYDEGHTPVEHLVYASSSSVYGSNKKVPYSTDDKVDNPVSLYAATKKSNELMAHAYSKLYNIPSTGLRFFTVYGPAGRPDMAYFGFTNKLLKGETIQIFNYGKQYKDAYAAAKRGQKAGTAASKQAAAATNTITEKAKAAVQEIVVQNKTLWVSIGVGILLVMVMLGAFSSCGAAIQGTGSTFVGTTYPSKDADMKGAEEDYLELEKELDKQIRQMESTHPGYDEYRYQLDEIGHDPYQLISHLTAVYEQFTRGQVKPVIKELFKQQYLLKVWETIEIRTRMETRVGVRPTIDAFGNVSMETYTYQEEVEYEYKILNILLKNKGFDTIARKNMNRKQTGRYDAYNLTYGNRPELFGAGSPTYSGGTTGSIGTGGGTGGSGGGFKYDIPSEALSDEKFARMIEEAEKYLGMPYVWGGSSPSTSFDCSGFVCWVINNCGNGWSVGRTTANGLRGKCSYVSRADAQPGDLVFFEKTYNTTGASHVGIYVGDGMMIHCGDPISYTSINSTYWQSHFLGFGRIN